MEHRCTDRYASDLSVLIYQHKLPVAISRIKNGSRSGVFIETDFTGIDCEHQIVLEVVLSRNGSHKGQCMEIQALVTHKMDKGFGAELEMKTQEQCDLFMKLLRGGEEKDTEIEMFAMAANQ